MSQGRFPKKTGSAEVGSGKPVVQTVFWEGPRHSASSRARALGVKTGLRTNKERTQRTEHTTDAGAKAPKPRENPKAPAEKKAPRSGTPLSRSPDHRGGARPSGAGKRSRGNGAPRRKQGRGVGAPPAGHRVRRCPPARAEPGTRQTFKTHGSAERQKPPGGWSVPVGTNNPTEQVAKSMVKRYAQADKAHDKLGNHLQILTTPRNPTELNRFLGNRQQR